MWNSTNVDTITLILFYAPIIVEYIIHKEADDVSEYKHKLTWGKFCPPSPSSHHHPAQPPLHPNPDAPPPPLPNQNPSKSYSRN